MSNAKKEIQKDIRRRFLEARADEERKKKEIQEACLKQKKIEILERKENEEKDKQWISFNFGRGLDIEITVWWDYGRYYFLETEKNNHKNNRNYIYVLTSVKGITEKVHTIFPYRGTFNEFFSGNYTPKCFGTKKIKNFAKAGVIFESTVANAPDRNKFILVV